jgi:uncharacterized protein (DUF1330 family)
MTTFVIATVTISDPEKYAEYNALIRGLLDRYNGALVLSAAVSDTLEGQTPEGERATVLKFPDEASARAYIASPEYQAGKAVREGAAEMTMRLVVT